MTDPKIADKDFIVAANKILRPHLDTDGYEIDADDETVSRNEDPDQCDGAFVKVWIWVDNAAAEGAYAAEEPENLMEESRTPEQVALDRRLAGLDREEA